MEKELYSLGEETEQIEFKKSTGEMKEGLISIVSILNKHHNGKLYFGVKNDGTVIGQEINDTTLRLISQAIGNHIRPAIYPTITKVPYGNRSVIEVKFEGTQQPYLAYNIPRIRVADEDLVMEQPMYEELMRKRGNISYSWESQKSKYKITSIDQKVFKSYMKRAKNVGRISFDHDDPTEVMTKLELSDGEWLLNAGAALFVDSGLNELQMAKFASDERLTFTDIRRFTGSIFDLADKAVQYVIDAMDWRVEFDGSLERKEIPEIPVDAVREAVINSFAHRLVESGQSVEVAIYRSFIEIYSPGKFPDSVTPEMFITEIRKPIRRNPLITRTLYYSKDMESFATGLKRIQDACDEVSCKVEYYSDDYGFTVRFYRHCGDGWGMDLSTQAGTHGTQAGTHGTQAGTHGTQGTQAGIHGTQVGTHGTQAGTQAGTHGTQAGIHGTQASIHGTREMNGYEAQIIEMITKNNRITRKQMAEELLVGLRTIQRIINSMEQIHFVGSGKNGRWVIDKKG